MPENFPRLPNIRELFEEKLDSHRTFEVLAQLAETLTVFLNRHEGVSVRSIEMDEYIHIEKKWNGMSPSKQIEKFKTFLSFYGICKQLIKTGSLRRKPEALRTFLDKFQLRIPSEDLAFSILGADTIFDVRNNRAEQVYRSVDFLGVTSHSILALELMSWWELFDLSHRSLTDWLALTNGIRNGKIRTPLLRPTAPDTVREICTRHPRVHQFESILFSPIYDSKKNIRGSLLLFNVNGTLSLTTQGTILYQRPTY